MSALPPPVSGPPSAASGIPSPVSAPRESRRSLGEDGPFRLAHWSPHEPSRSRRTDEALDRFWLPAHLDTFGHGAIAAEPDGPALLAAWHVLLIVAARLPRPLRGFLVTESGRACTAADLARFSGFPAALFTRALDFFSSPDVGWLVPLTAAELSTGLAGVLELRALRDRLAHTRDLRRRVHRDDRAAHRSREALVAHTAAPGQHDTRRAEIIAEEKRVFDSVAAFETFTVLMERPAPLADATLYPTSAADAPSPPTADTPSPTSLSASPDPRVSVSPSLPASPQALDPKSETPPSPRLPAGFPPDLPLEGTELPPPPPLPPPVDDLDAPAPPQAPENWRQLLINVCEPTTQDQLRFCQTIGWYRLNPKTQRLLLDHPRALHRRAA